MTKKVDSQLTYFIARNLQIIYKLIVRIYRELKKKTTGDVNKVKIPFCFYMPETKIRKKCSNIL